MHRRSRKMAIARITRISGAITLLITIFSLSLPAYAKYSGGTGESNDPYQIATAEDLMLLGETPKDYDKHFIMTADIDLDPNLPERKVFDRAVIAPDMNDTESGFQGTSFSGVFDGNDNIISHLTIEGGGRLGLFGLSFGSKISNLGLEAVDVNGTGSVVGGLVGENNGSINNCYSTGTVSGGRMHVGGLVGGNSGTITTSYSTAAVSGVYLVGGLVGMSDRSITASYSTGDVTGDENLGGLVGVNRGGNITASYSTGTVIGDDAAVGGLVGQNISGSILGCYSIGDVGGCKMIGGLVGWNKGEGSISDCYSAGDVSGGWEIGGLVGENSGVITMSYSTSVVSGNTRVGGLVGSNSCVQNAGAITDSYWDIETSGELKMCGLQEEGASGCDPNCGKTTTEMQTASTFLKAGWDFVDETDNGTEGIWKIMEGQTYPLLSCQKYGGGTGEPNDPYLIYTAEHLNALGAEPNDYDKHFKLMADIDLSEYTYDRAVIAPDTNDVENWYQGIPFTGVFDGNDHTISHLTITGDLDRYYYVGLFGQLAPDAELKNLGVVDVNIIVGGRYIGGLVGDNSGAVIRCNSTGAVSGGSHVGGLAGGNSGSITMSYSTAVVSGYFILGGLVGRSDGSITTSYSTGDVSGDENVGGLVCGNLGSISNSYSTGKVVAYDAYSGGFVAGNSGSITSSFWDIEASWITTSDGGIGKTTNEMQTASTFLEAGWDFVDEAENGTEDIWWIDEGQDYPRLWWEAAEQ